MSDAPLTGLRVLELGQLIAGPACATLLGWLGADVVKVEPPAGDPLRSWRCPPGATGEWFRSVARGKRLVAADLHDPAGRARVAALAARADVLVENFRPGRMEAWGLGPEALWPANPGLVYCRVSGHGQRGPRAGWPGFAAVAEALGGLRALTGHPGGPTLRTNLSLADSVAGMQATIGVLAALIARGRTGRGQVVDVSLVDTVASLLEAAPAEAAAGRPRGPAGASIDGVVPTGAFRCADGAEIVLGANSDGLFRRLMHAIGCPALAADPALATNPGRVAQRDRVDGAIAAWAAARTAAAAEAALVAAGIPAGRVRLPAELLDDRSLWDRGTLESLTAPDGWSGPLVRPGPVLSHTPGRSAFAGGGPVGADTDAVLADWGRLPGPPLGPA